MGIQALRRRTGSDDTPDSGLITEWSTNTALFAMVIGAVGLLWAINRGFRGFVINT